MPNSRLNFQPKRFPILHSRWIDISNVGYFGHGRFGQDISAMDISAMENVKGGRFGHNHKFICLCVCMGGLMFVHAPGCMYMFACMNASCMLDGALLSD